MRISDWSSDVCSSDLRDVDARGLELDPELVERGVSRGLSVVQGDANCDLRDYPDRAFDYAILSQPLQTEIGRASCRERVCQYVSISVVAVSLKKITYRSYLT